MSNFSASWSPESLQELVRWAGIPTLLQPQVQTAMGQIVDLVLPAARGNMHWKQGHGDLADSLHRISESPYEITYGSELPYARRREKGFDGADSLGRVYHDLGAYFLQQAEEDNEQAGLALLQAALMQVLAAGGNA